MVEKPRTPLHCISNLQVRTSEQPLNTTPRSSLLSLHRSPLSEKSPTAQLLFSFPFPSPLQESTLFKLCGERLFSFLRTQHHYRILLQSCQLDNLIQRNLIQIFWIIVIIFRFSANLKHH